MTAKIVSAMILSPLGENAYAGPCSTTTHNINFYARMQGPMSSADVTMRERLDRPTVDIYQRHVGTDLPEAAHLIHVRLSLLISIHCSCVPLNI